jgi:hypothetical protein
MSHHSGKLFSTILAAVISGSVLTMVSYGPARADDTCLSGPKATTPRGSHWYYRVEAGTKRHCWYLGEERGKPAQTAAAKPSSPAPASDKPTQPSAAPLQPSVANARAEFAGAAANDQAATAVSPVPDTPAANTATADAVPAADTSRSTVTTRWPDPAISAPPSQPASSLAATAKPAAQLLGERSEPGPAVRVATAFPSQASSYSMPMLLGGLAGALAFAGFLGFAVVKFGSLNRLGQIRRRRESIWDSADNDRPAPWQTQNINAPLPSREETLRTRRDIEAQSRDILELLSRASREAAT